MSERKGIFNFFSDIYEATKEIYVDMKKDVNAVEKGLEAMDNFKKGYNSITDIIKIYLPEKSSGLQQ